MQYWAPLLNSNCKALFLLNYCFGFWLCDSSTVTCRLFITYLPTNRCSFYLPLEDLSYFDPLPKPTLKINETLLQKRWRLNAKHNNMAAAADAGTKQRSRSWTETELKYFAFVLLDEENDFGYKLDTRVDEDCKQNCFRGDKEGSWGTYVDRRIQRRKHFFVHFILAT